MIIKVYRDNELTPIVTFRHSKTGWHWLTQFGPLGFGTCSELSTAFAHFEKFNQEFLIP